MLDEIAVREWLRQERVGSSALPALRVAGHVHDPKIRVASAKVRREIVAAPIRQKDVGEEQADLAVELRADPERLAGRRGVQDPVALRGEHPVGREPEGVFVVDDEDGPKRSSGYG